jgi:hypothetical protein
MAPPRRNWQQGNVRKGANDDRMYTEWDLLESGRPVGVVRVQLTVDGQLTFYGELEQDLFDSITNFDAKLLPKEAV